MEQENTSLEKAIDIKAALASEMVENKDFASANKLQSEVQELIERRKEVVVKLRVLRQKERKSQYDSEAHQRRKLLAMGQTQAERPGKGDEVHEDAEGDEMPVDEARLGAGEEDVLDAIPDLP